MQLVPVLETRRLVLTILPASAASRLLTFAIENDAHLARWEPPHPDGFFTEGFWRRRLDRSREELARGESLRFSIAHRDAPDGPVLGHCNFNQIVRGSFQACYLGYSVDHRWQGKGIMFEALQRSIEYVFGPMRLHRIMANYIPTNERSGSLLRRLGFQVEGYARDYLYIHDGWRDHLLTSLTNPNAAPPAPGV